MQVILNSRNKTPVRNKVERGAVIGIDKDTEGKARMRLTATSFSVQVQLTAADVDRLLRDLRGQPLPTASEMIREAWTPLK